MSTGRKLARRGKELQEFLAKNPIFRCKPERMRRPIFQSGVGKLLYDVSRAPASSLSKIRGCPDLRVLLFSPHVRFPRDFSRRERPRSAPSQVISPDP